MNSFDLTEENFLNLLNEAKLTKLDFMNLIEHSNNINILSSWIKKGRFPYYVKLILDTAIKVKKYKEYEQQGIKSDTLTFNEEDIKKLEEENKKLENEIKKYEKLEELFADTFGFKIGEKNERKNETLF
ncbi:hypothetical protein [Campylobacter helveticus]|uniref:hypothetical protein n=1 Tax=Campylobacter helveticus TaxID=28898 RepID=UPI0022EA4D30|nr:hypothetical protein [Campylobacter helveticus]